MTSRSAGMPSGAAQPRPSPPSSRPTSPTSPELPRWRFKNASRKLGGYSSEWNDGKVFGGEEADEGAEEGKVGFMEARARLKSVHDEEKRRKDEEFQGGNGVVSSSGEAKEEQPEQLEEPEPEAPTATATATDESSFDTAPDEASAQPADPEETLSTANQDDDERSLSTANSRAAQSHKSYFDELQTREGERLEEPKLAWGPNNEEMKGLMQSLGRLVYGHQEDESEEEEEISVVDEASVVDEPPKADAGELAQEETQDVNAVNSTSVDLDVVDKEADAEVQTINSGDNGDGDDDELDKIEKQEKLDDVDLTTEEEPSVEHEDELEKEKTTTEEPVQYSRRKKQLILLSILSVIIIVAVVLGVLLAGGNADDGTCRADGEECVPNNCQNWKCGDTDCCCCGGLTCVADTGLGGERPMCG